MSKNAWMVFKIFPISYNTLCISNYDAGLIPLAGNIVDNKYVNQFLPDPERS